MDSAVAKILVVDDDPDVRKYVEELLAQKGYAVTSVAHGQGALAHLATTPVDLVLLDVLMPGMDGFAVCKQIRHRAEYLPVLFMTGQDDAQARALAAKAGGDDFIGKPIGDVELLSRVQQLLQARLFQAVKHQHQQTLASELEQTKEQLIRIERLAGLGTMAAGVGHELNNVTSVLDAAIYEIKSSRASKSPPSIEGIDMLATVSQHLRLYGKELLHLGKPYSQHVERVDLREITHSTVSMLRTLGRTKQARVQVRTPEHQVFLRVDRTRMEQVLVNLLGNAADALEDVRGRDRAIAVGIDCPPGSVRAVCQVQDNGSGIPTDKLTTIFEPYYTTKSEGHGTGLGLPVCKHILESYGGSLSVESTLGAGTTFTFQLPVD